MFRSIVVGVGIAAVLVAQPDPASAQRWAASGGSSSACTRETPCTFATAVNSAPEGSEVKCLDNIMVLSGQVSISTSITVNCETFPITIVSATITVAPSSPTAVVKLRGVNLNGAQQGGSVGLYFLNFTGQGLLIIERFHILATAGANGGFSIRPNGPAKVVMTDSTVADHGSGGNILIRPTGGAPLQAVFNRVTTAGSSFGIKADGSGQSSGVIDVEVRDSVASSHSANGFIAASNAGQAQVRYKVTNSTAAGNAAYGAVASGPQAFMIVDGSSLTGNGTGLGQLAGSIVATPGNNIVNFNATNVAGTITAISGR